ncbi:MAG TPA: YtxH domain-containing protein [Candidatus Saccharimonadales bacterium]|nr:YtxH domain-containing protein [Candidatus Saccharimonadales bacterium]
MGRWQDLQDMIDNYSGRRQPDNNAIAVAVLAGAAAGLAAGILLAPDSGRQTMRRIKSKARDNLQDAADKASDMNDTVKDKANKASDTARRAREDNRNTNDDVQEGSAGRRTRRG